MANDERADFDYPDPRNRDLHDRYVEFEQERFRDALGRCRTDEERSCCQEIFPTIKTKKEFWDWLEMLPNDRRDRLTHEWMVGYETATKLSVQAGARLVWRIINFGLTDEDQRVSRRLK